MSCWCLYPGPERIIGHGTRAVQPAEWRFWYKWTKTKSRATEKRGKGSLYLILPKLVKWHCIKVMLVLRLHYKHVCASVSVTFTEKYLVIMLFLPWRSYSKIFGKCIFVKLADMVTFPTCVLSKVKKLQILWLCYLLFY